MAASRPNARKKDRGSSNRVKTDRRTVDARQAALFFGIVIALIAAVIAGAYYFAIEGGERSTLSLNCYNTKHDITPNGTAQFVFVLENKAGDRNTAAIEITEKPENWTVQLDQQWAILYKGTRQLIILTVRSPEGVDSGIFPIEVSATSQFFGGKASHAEVEVKAKPQTSNRTVEDGDDIKVDYVGYFTNGTIFDTNVESVGGNKNAPKTGDFNPKKDYEPLSVDPVGEGKVIQGFDEGLVGMQLGETRFIVVPPEKGYTSESHPLYGKTLNFEVTLVRFD